MMPARLSCHTATAAAALLLLLAESSSARGNTATLGANSPAAESPASSSSSSTKFPATSYGAVADGKTLNTAPLQKAIDAAHAAGGGTVLLEAGIYLTGTLELRSGVTLFLEKGATLLGSPHIADYRRGNWPALILAKDQERVGIAGEGTIDGQGKLVAADTVRIFESGNYVEFFPVVRDGDKVFVGTAGTGGNKSPWIDPHAMQREGTLRDRVAPRSRDDMATWRVDEIVRPQLLEFWNCRDVRVSGVTLKNAANWVQTYRECDDVAISGIRVRSTAYWNNDGLDLINCRRVRIEDCDIDAADDAICLKSEPSAENRACEDIFIARCKLRSSASALKFGTASHNGFRRIRAEDLEVYDTYRSAIALETVDGAVIENIRISRVRVRNTGNAIFLCIGQRNPAKPPGILRDVELSDIEAEIPSGRPDAAYEHRGPPLKVAANLIPSSIIGLPDQPVENVVLRNITLVYGGGGRRDRAEIPLSKLDSLPDRRRAYPEFSMFGELPAWGFYMRHAQGVRFENVTFRLASPDYRAAFVADSVQNLGLHGVKFRSAGEEPVLVLANVRGETLDGVEWPETAGETIRRLPPQSP